jgi:hypothetical protein
MPTEDGQTEVRVNQQQTMTASAVGGAVGLVPQGKSPKGNRGISGTSKNSYVKERFQTEQEKTLQRYEYRPCNERHDDDDTAGGSGDRRSGMPSSAEQWL